MQAHATRKAKGSVSVIREDSFVTHDGVTIAYNIVGRGPPMILCDGIGCDQYAWKYLVPFFQDRYTIVRWNYRGHGKSSTPKDFGRLEMEDVRQDLHQLIARENLQGALLVGHSMGVQVVLDYYAQHRADISGLVAVCGAPGQPLKTFHDSDTADRLFPYLFNTITRFPNQVRALWKRLPLRVSYEIAIRTEVNKDFVKIDDFMPYFEHLFAMDPVVFFTMLRSLNNHSVADTLPKVDVPTLIVAAERDTFTPAWLSHQMHDAISNSELLFIPGGTHTAPIEFPELLNLRLDKFLRERT